MHMIESDEADLINLDSGLGYFAGRQHNMMPIMAEDYPPTPQSSSLPGDCFIGLDYLQTASFCYYLCSSVHTLIVTIKGS